MPSSTELARAHVHTIGPTTVTHTGHTSIDILGGTWIYRVRLWTTPYSVANFLATQEGLMAEMPLDHQC